jgi:hypothetical protein
MRRLSSAHLALVIAVALVAASAVRSPAQKSAPTAAPSPLDALAATLSRFHQTLDVFTDPSAAGNHFVAPARLLSLTPAEAERFAADVAVAVPPMIEVEGKDAEGKDAEGKDAEACGRPTCLHAAFRPRGRITEGGWQFLNGVLHSVDALPVDSTGRGVAPDLNFGIFPDAGVDLRGATVLEFDVKGRRGGEIVEFFAFGVGRDPTTGRPLVSDQATGRPIVAPDSSPAAKTGYLKLSTSWERKSIRLDGRDLSYVVGGFGWMASGDRNGGRDIDFYLDDIRFDRPRSDEPRFPLSFDTPMTDKVLRNTAFVYDAAVAAIAFLAAGDFRRAQMIVDALLYAQDHDRYYEDGRLRNAYAAGDLILPPGWIPNGKRDTVRMPGWYDKDRETGELQWFEDRFQVSTHTGNMAWAMLAWLAYYEATSGTVPAEVRARYLAATVRLGEWINGRCRDPRGGYTGGFEAWEPSPEALSYRSTEHNIDLVAAFERVATATGDKKWLERADHAFRFVESMWDGREKERKFWTGTLGGSSRPNESVVPLDPQTWAVLALGERGRPYWPALTYAATSLKAPGIGVAFSNADRNGVWFEGTAQLVLAYQATGRSADAQPLLELLRSPAARDRSGSGAILAASTKMFTGFEAVPGVDWHYFPWAHTGATAWVVLAERSFNPFLPVTPVKPRTP